MPKKKEKGDSEKKPENTPKLSKEMEDKLKELRVKLEKFKDRIIEKFDKYIMGVILLPPEQPRPAQPAQPFRANPSGRGNAGCHHRTAFCQLRRGAAGAHRSY